MEQSGAGRPTGLVLASLLVIASASVMLTSFRYVLVEMQLEFHSSPNSCSRNAGIPCLTSTATSSHRPPVINP